MPVDLLAEPVPQGRDLLGEPAAVEAVPAGRDLLSPAPAVPATDTFRPGAGPAGEPADPAAPAAGVVQVDPAAPQAAGAPAVAADTEQAPMAKGGSLSDVMEARAAQERANVAAYERYWETVDPMEHLRREVAARDPNAPTVSDPMPEPQVGGLNPLAGPAAAVEKPQADGLPGVLLRGVRQHGSNLAAAIDAFSSHDPLGAQYRQQQADERAKSIVGESTTRSGQFVEGLTTGVLDAGVTAAGMAAAGVPSIPVAAGQRVAGAVQGVAPRAAGAAGGLTAAGVGGAQFGAQAAVPTAIATGQAENIAEAAVAPFTSLAALDTPEGMINAAFLLLGGVKGYRDLAKVRAEVRSMAAKVHQADPAKAAQVRAMAAGRDTPHAREIVAAFDEVMQGKQAGGTRPPQAAPPIAQIAPEKPSGASETPVQPVAPAPSRPVEAQKPPQTAHAAPTMPVEQAPPSATAPQNDANAKMRDHIQELADKEVARLTDHIAELEDRIRRSEIRDQTADPAFAANRKGERIGWKNEIFRTKHEIRRVKAEAEKQKLNYVPAPQTGVKPEYAVYHGPDSRGGKWITVMQRQPDGSFVRVREVEGDTKRAHEIAAEYGVGEYESQFGSKSRTVPVKTGVKPPPVENPDAVSPANRGMADDVPPRSQEATSLGPVRQPGLVTGKDLLAEPVPQPESVPAGGGAPAPGVGAKAGKVEPPVGYKTTPTEPQKAPAATRRFTKPEIDNALERAMGTVEGTSKREQFAMTIEARSAAARAGEAGMEEATDVTTPAMFSEAYKQLNGRQKRSMKMLGVVVNDDIAQSQIEMAGEQLYDDAIAEMLEGGDKESRITAFADKVSKNPGLFDEETRLMAYLRSKWSGLTLEQRNAKQEIVNPQELPTGTKVTIRGESFEVIREGGETMLKDGITLNVDNVREVPVDKGSVAEPKPKKTSGQQLGLLGDKTAGGITGSKSGSLFETRRETSKAIEEDAEFRAKQTPKDKETGEMFASLPPPPGQRVSGRQGGSSELPTMAARKIIDTMQAAGEAATKAASNTPKVLSHLFRRGTNWMERAAPKAGKEMAKNLRDIDFRVSKGENNALEDLAIVYKDLNAEQRAAVSKAVNMRPSQKDAPANIRDRADRVRAILDKYLLKQAQDLGFERRHADGGKTPLKGSGKAFPQMPNKEGQRVLKEAEELGLGSPRVMRAAEQMVANGQAENVDAALAQLRDFAEQQKRATNPYLERTRTELPEELVEWDPDKVLPRVIHRALMSIEGVREWGMDFPKQKALLERIKMESDAATAEAIDRFLQHHFGAGGKVLRPDETLAGMISNYQVLMKLGFSPLSAIRNASQPIINTTRYPLHVVLKAYKKMPPIIWRFFKEAKKLRDETVRSGAVRSTSSLANIEENVPGSGITQTGMKLFGAVEKGNQVRAALIARYGLENDLAALAKIQGGESRAANLIRTITSLGNMTEAAIKRRLQDVTGLTPQQVGEWMTKGKPLTENELHRAMSDVVRDTQFPVTLATERIWWPLKPWLRLWMKFKVPFGADQLGHVYGHVLREGLKGNFRPLVGFLLSALVANELYHIIRDTVTGDEKSITKRTATRPDTRTAGDIAASMANHMKEGAGVGLIADLSYGIPGWVGGPLGSTASNTMEAGANFGKRPSQFGLVLRDFLESETAVSKQAEGLANRVEKIAGNTTNHYHDYRIWRGRVFEYLGEKEDAGDFFADMMLGRQSHGVTDRTLSYQYAARQVTLGDVDDAAFYLRGILADAETEDEKKSIVKGMRLSMKAKSPLGKIAEKDRAAFLAKFTPEQREEAKRLQADWIKAYESAIKKAGGDLDNRPIPASHSSPKTPPSPK